MSPSCVPVPRLKETSKVPLVKPEPAATTAIAVTSPAKTVTSEVAPVPAPASVGSNTVGGVTYPVPPLVTA